MPKPSCNRCKYRNESPISGHCEGCNNHSKFEPALVTDLCKWCNNTAAPDDNVCESCRKNMKNMATNFDEVIAHKKQQLEELKALLNQAYSAGFNDSGEGYNAEYPFGGKGLDPQGDHQWISRRDKAINDILTPPKSTTDLAAENETLKAAIWHLAKKINTNEAIGIVDSLPQQIVNQIDVISIVNTKGVIKK